MRKGIIYKVTSPSGKIYIGQTINGMNIRRSAHFSVAFNRNSHNYNTKFNYAIRKYNTELKWDIIATLAEDQLDGYEISSIGYYNSYHCGYNGTLGGVGVKKDKNYKHPLKGKSFTAEHKQKISLALKGRVFSKSHRKNLSKAQKGNVPSKETCEKISKAHIGKPSGMLGKTHSNEFKINHSKRMSGKNHPLYGIGHTNKSRQKMSRSHLAGGKSKGENNGRAKLNWSKVREIRHKFSIGQNTKAELSREYFVTHATICAIINKKLWKE